ncbi:NusG domain II-containing protein [Catenisphaera adipataccumulans]|jgi:hypothetical protein|uniref:NusG domain-containing protein n=1 Tax=Catenisphaera adipataccumulans TaxID=700500 RepID=A0A7W8CYS9_9FIRM|nr:NusG domain II-containing protein [Catenisphaera adipataccumulans]MBB5182869.1 hypothetical protein [Catenisphaera adipataccumulans]
MTRADKILIVAIMILSAGLIVPLLNHVPQASQAVVTVSDQEVMRIDLSKDGKYSVDGKLGKVYIQVKDGQIRVTQENSPRHICSQQGYVSDPNTPIVCLPNETVITIESDEQSNEDTVIQ